MNPELIVFDLNKTLIKENSWRDLNLAMGVTPAEDAELMEQARRGEITDAEGQAELLKIYQQRGDVSRSNIEKILWQYTYMPYARDVVSELRKRGYNLAIFLARWIFLCSMWRLSCKLLGGGLQIGLSLTRMTSLFYLFFNP